MAEGVPGMVPAARTRLRRSPHKPGILRDCKGVAALEFALVAMLFVFWLISLITFGLHIGAQSAIDAATQNAGRQIQVGAIRGGSADPVRSLICASLQGMNPLCSDIQVYATSGASFASLNLATLAGKTLSSASFAPGQPGSFVLLQVAYNSPFAVPLAGISSLTLTSTIAFRNEP